MLRNSLVFSTSLTIVFTTLGCDPKDSDDEVTDPGGSTTGGEDPDDTGEGLGNDNPHGWGCIDSSTVIDVAAQTALGFSAEDMLDGKLGTRQSDLRFFTEPTFLSSEIAGKTLPLEVTLAWEGGEVRLVESELDPNYEYDWGESDGAFEPECHDRIEVDVVFSFVTAGGELDEQRQTTLVARSVDRAHIARGSVTAEGTDLYPPALQGSLDPDAVFDDPDMTLRVLVAMATWHGELAGGALSVEMQGGPDHGDGGWIGFGPIASWGDEIPFFEED